MSGDTDKRSWTWQMANSMQIKFPLCRYNEQAASFCHPSSDRESPFFWSLHQTIIHMFMSPIIIYICHHSNIRQPSTWHPFFIHFITRFFNLEYLRHNFRIQWSIIRNFAYWALVVKCMQACVWQTCMHVTDSLLRKLI